MRYGNAVTDETTAAKPAFRPRLAIIGIVAASVVALVILIIIVVKIAGGAVQVPLGVTDSDELQLGSCLEEEDADLDEYTVVDCSVGHPQQVVATIDLGKTENVYTQYAAMSSYAQEVCDRLIEYGLYVREDTSSDDYEFVVLAMPTEKQFEGGQTDALCAIVHTEGDELTESFYRPMP